LEKYLIDYRQPFQLISVTGIVQNCLSRAIRFSIGGWVMKRELKLNETGLSFFGWGLSINIWATSFRLTASIRGSAEIFSRAEARASGFLVIVAEPASAIYSLCREMANLKMDDRK
jgi:hypothetical protein